MGTTMYMRDVVPIYSIFICLINNRKACSLIDKRLKDSINYNFKNLNKIFKFKLKNCDSLVNNIR